MACKYILNVDGKEVVFDSREALLKHIKTNQLYDTVPRKAGNIDDLTTSNLALVLRQMNFGEPHFDPTNLKIFQSELLEKFVSLEEEAQFYYKVNSALSLTKGPGKSFEHIDTIKRNMADLGINAEFSPEKIPFDVRYLLTGDAKYQPFEGQYYHKITAKKLQLLSEIDSLSKVSFMDRTNTFVGISNRVIANLKDSVAGDIDKVKEIRDELAAFIQIAAYKRWIDINDRKTNTLRNSLLYDGDLPTIVDIVKNAQSLAPNNAFLKFILPVSTIVKSAKKQQRNILNRDLINTIEGKTRGHLEPDMISTLMDSFTELYQNPQTSFHAKALFDYLIVKDGLMFKNRSFIRMIPPFMFKDMSDATDMAVQILSASTLEQYKSILKKFNTLEIVNKNGEFVPYFSAEERVKFNELFKEKNVLGVRDALYKKIFGYTFSELYNRFENIHNTDVGNQFDLNLVRTKNKTVMTTYKTDKNETYLHITYFTKPYKEAKPEEKKAMKKKLLEELESGGISVSPFGETGEGKATDLEFKKYIRVQSSEGKYHLYQLVSIAREQRNYEGDAMVPAGELVPRGTYAVYKEIDPVGTSNSTGVADLGVRPTKESLQKIIIDKIKQQKPPQVTPIQTVLFSTSGLSIDKNESYTQQRMDNALGTRDTFMSNFHQLTIPIKDEFGNEYWNSEGHYMAQRTSDQNIKRQIAEASKQGGQASRGARKQYTLEQDENLRVQYMMNSVRAKFAVNPNLAVQLIATGSQEIIEKNNWKDDLFGVRQDTLKGANILGKALMIVRDELKGGSVPVTPTSIQPVAPTAGETIEGGMFGGFQVGNFDPNELGAGFDIPDDEVTNVVNEKDQGCIAPK
jgi:predicted NAD-dependent protein-ADP-ribosyltransferase YbiA (DUF1768 family)